MANIYKGFSTINRSKKFRVGNFDLVKTDLYNHFQIKKGEKLMQPNFGSIIWSLLFEPMDATTHQLIVDDVTKIVGYDPDKTTPGKPRTGYVQVDFMPGDPDWLKTFFHAPHEKDSKYKGVYRNILLSSIAAHLDRKDSPETIADGRPAQSERYLWSQTEGLVRVIRTPEPSKRGDGYTKKNINKVIAGPYRTSDEIAKILRLDGPDDLYSYETLRKAIDKNYSKELVRSILKDFANNSVIASMGVPDDIQLNESAFGSNEWFRMMMDRLS